MLKWLAELFGFQSKDVPEPEFKLKPAPAEPEVAPTTSGDTKSPPSRSRRFDRIPRQVLAVDVETTGLSGNDRMVSFAGILMDTEALENGEWSLRFVHLVFDPGFKGSAQAERVHGYSDWFLRHQPFATENIDLIEDLFKEADVIVAHNASFDMDFISREFVEAGLDAPIKPVFCTMEGWRQYYPGLRASLNAVCRGIGIGRMSQRHGALEDAWLALQVYLYLRSDHTPIGFLPDMPMAFANEQPVPPMPEGPLPRRKRRKKVQTGGGR